MNSDPIPVEVRAADSVRIEPAEWEARAASMYRSLADEPDVPREAVAEALRELRLRDAAGATWFYDGMTWHAWDGAAWRPGRPAGSLWLQPFTMTLFPAGDDQPPLGIPRLDETTDDVLPFDQSQIPAEDDEPEPVPLTPRYQPTHRVPAGGLPVWAVPDAGAAPVAALDAGLDVMVAEQQPNGWTRVVCSNGWSGWVDGRRLLAG